MMFAMTHYGTIHGVSEKTKGLKPEARQAGLFVPICGEYRPPLWSVMQWRHSVRTPRIFGQPCKQCMKKLDFHADLAVDEMEALQKFEKKK